jgi:thioredoxin reductase (NADPH)
MKNQPLTEVAIIGAGPIGLELAVALKKAAIDYLQFDARQIGHTISWFAPQTRFFSSNERIAIAGVPLETPDQNKATREQYLAYLRTVVRQFDLQIHTYEPVSEISREKDHFRLKTTKSEYHAKKIVLASGGTERPRLLNIPGENLPNVSHYFQDPHTYFGKELLIVGGRNSAVEAALRCHYSGAKVTLCYRKADIESSGIKYWLLPEITGLIRSGAIKAYFNSTVSEIQPDRVVISTDGNSREIPADFVLLLIGYEADMTLCNMCGVELESGRKVPKFDPRTMLTNVPSVYVAGTAVGGTQERYSVFIENCHVHVDRIIASLCGKPPPSVPAAKFERPES